jgi:hypothetical protein
MRKSSHSRMRKPSQRTTADGLCHIRECRTRAAWTARPSPDGRPCDSVARRSPGPSAVIASRPGSKGAGDTTGFAPEIREQASAAVGIWPALMISPDSPPQAPGQGDHRGVDVLLHAPVRGGGQRLPLGRVSCRVSCLGARRVRPQNLLFRCWLPGRRPVACPGGRGRPATADAVRSSPGVTGRAGRRGHVRIRRAAEPIRPG